MRPDISKTLAHPVLRSLKMVIEDRWLSVEEICKYLGVSNDTVYKWIAARLIDSLSFRSWKLINGFE